MGGGVRHEKDLPMDDRIENAIAEWRCLPWYKRLGGRVLCVR